MRRRTSLSTMWSVTPPDRQPATSSGGCNARNWTTLPSPSLRNGYRRKLCRASGLGWGADTAFSPVSEALGKYERPDQAVFIGMLKVPRGQMAS